MRQESVTLDTVSLELWNRIVKAHESGMFTQIEIARLVGLNLSTVNQIIYWHNRRDCSE